MFNHEELEVFFNGEFLPFPSANVSIANTSLLYGLGVFTGVRAFKNPATEKMYIFRPNDHYERLKKSCKMMRYDKFSKSYSRAQFVDILKDLLIKNKIQEDVYYRVTNFTFDNKITAKFIGYNEALSAFLYPIGDYVPTNGMRCKISSYARTSDSATPARAKITGLYVNTAFAKTEALLAGFDEAIFLNNSGHVVEGSAENLFLVRDGALITPPLSDEILEGITRATIMEIAKDKGIECIERSILRSELVFADEIFLTGTGAKVSPVVDIDHYQIGSGQVGPISKLLQDTYLAAARGELPEYHSWVEEVDTRNA